MGSMARSLALNTSALPSTVQRASDVAAADLLPGAAHVRRLRPRPRLHARRLPQGDETRVKAI